MILVCPHDAFNGGAALKTNLIHLLFLKHKIVHPFLAELAYFSVFVLTGKLDLVLATLFKLHHISPHAETVLVPLQIFKTLLL